MSDRSKEDAVYLTDMSDAEQIAWLRESEVRIYHQLLTYRESGLVLKRGEDFSTQFRRHALRLQSGVNSLYEVIRLREHLENQTRSN